MAENKTETSFTLIETALPVKVFEDDGHWVCEGYGLDYLSTGDTREDAIDHFRTGLRLTLEENGKRGLFFK